jgi:DNA mismatch endonuclease (patch repair protein)
MSQKYIRDGRAPIPDKETTSKVMSSIRGKNTKPELELRKVLYQNGLLGYRIHWKKVPGRPDIAYPSKKIAIFVNGCFWHRCPYCNPPFPKTHGDFWTAKFENNIERDKRKKADLENLGWTVLVFWECKINNEIDSCVQQIKLVVDSKY